MSTWNDAIADLSERMLSAILMLPPQIGPEPLRCPVCGRTRLACVQFYGHDPVHEQDIRDTLTRNGASVLDCLEAAMRADPSLMIEEAIRTVPVSGETLRQLPD